MTDIVIIGGGVIGLSIAYELAGQGASVQVLEQNQFGQESSWAGAGMIMPADPMKATTIEARLRAASFQLWPDWSQRLHDETGIDNGFFNCGGIELFPGSAVAELTQSAQQLRADGAIVEEFNASELQQLEPNLNREITHALHLPQMCQVRNPRHLKSLLAACHARGVLLTTGAAVIGFERRSSRITAARTAAGSVRADQFVVCGGAWSQSILEAASCHVEIEPVRGQIVLLDEMSNPMMSK